MKKIISLILVLALALCLVPVLAEEEAADEEASELVLMSHEDYVLAEMDAPVYVETYVQAHQNSRKLSISLRYRAEVVRIDVHTVDYAELVGVNVFKSVSACNSQNCGSLHRIGGELLLHYGIESLKLPHRIKAHVLFVVVKTYFFPWVAHIQHLSKSYSSFIRK